MGGRAWLVRAFTRTCHVRLPLSVPDSHVLLPDTDRIRRVRLPVQAKLNSIHGIRTSKIDV